MSKASKKIGVKDEHTFDEDEEVKREPKEDLKE